MSGVVARGVNMGFGVRVGVVPCLVVEACHALDILGVSLLLVRIIVVPFVAVFQALELQLVQFLGLDQLSLHRLANLLRARGLHLP